MTCASDRKAAIRCGGIVFDYSDASRDIEIAIGSLLQFPPKVRDELVERFFALFDRGRLDVSVASSSAAPGTADHIIRLRIGGVAELRAAALRALGPL